MVKDDPINVWGKIDKLCIGRQLSDLEEDNFGMYLVEFENSFLVVSERIF